MKTNLFKVKKVKKEKKKVTLEEEQLYNPLLILGRRYGCLGILFFFLIILIIVGVIIITVANLVTSQEGNYIDKELAFEYGDNNVVIGESNYNDNWIDTYANVYKKEGIIFAVRTFRVIGGTITYYSDESSKLVRDDGTIVRISRLPNGGYGIDENGTINSRSKRKSVTITRKEELSSGTYIIYYSDNSAEITKGDKTILVRNSDQINKSLNDIEDISPSGVSYKEKEEMIGQYKLTYYTDGTIKIENGTNTYLIQNKDDININNSEITFPNNNASIVIKTLTLNDGTKITYYSDGSALIETFYNTEIMVRKSGDIILNENESFWEITNNNITFAVYTNNTQNGDEITYYDDGTAIIRHQDKTSEYITQNSNIKYNKNGNINIVDEEIIQETKVIKTPDGTIITNFANDKSRVENINGNDYITDTKNIIIDTNGNLIEDENNLTKYNPREVESIIPDDDEPDGEVTGNIETIADNYYSFTIDNDSKASIKYKVVLEESNNYDQYNYQDKILSAGYIKYNLILGDKYFEDINLNNNIWTYDNKNNYVLYEGTLNKKDSLDVMLYLYLDYKILDNRQQDKLFLGTIKLYIEQ